MHGHVNVSIIPSLLDYRVGVWVAVNKEFGCKSVDENGDGLNV